MMLWQYPVSSISCRCLKSLLTLTDISHDPKGVVAGAELLRGDGITYNSVRHSRTNHDRDSKP